MLARSPRTALARTFGVLLGLFGWSAAISTAYAVQIQVEWSTDAATSTFLSPHPVARATMAKAAADV